MRVRFILTKYALESGKVVATIREVFGHRLARYANCHKDVVVECSSERFVRFMIARNDHNATNSFKDLKLAVVEPGPIQKIESFD